MLLLEVCGNRAEQHECKSLCEQATLYGIKTICKAVKNNNDLESILSSNDSFDYIYLSAHGCAESFESEDTVVKVEWYDFAGYLCTYNCLREDGILMLSCCRGGLMQIAYELFESCSQISYVLGPRQALSPIDMLTCFSVFLYNIEQRGLDPVVACEKIKCATDQRFSCYDRQEEEVSIANYNATYYISAIYDRIHQKVDQEVDGDS